MKLSRAISSNTLLAHTEIYTHTHPVFLSIFSFCISFFCSSISSSVINTHAHTQNIYHTLSTRTCTCTHMHTRKHTCTHDIYIYIFVREQNPTPMPRGQTGEKALWLLDVLLQSMSDGAFLNKRVYICKDVW